MIMNILKLCKTRISLLAALSTAAGWVLASDVVSYEMLPAVAGVFLLACGACALNQVQERVTDALMERTRGRPIPAGRISPRKAIQIALVLCLAGASLLAMTQSLTTLLLGLVAVFWYNGVYTFLKKISSWAAVPGALIGALPPMIGWTAAGGSLLDPQIMAVAFFMFLWQVPHFWLLVLNDPGDYERAGLPTIATIFTHKQLQRIIFVWIMSTAVACLILPIFGIVQSLMNYAALSAAAFWLAWVASSLVRKDGRQIPFQAVHLFALFVISLISLDRLLNFPS